MCFKKFLISKIFKNNRIGRGGSIMVFLQIFCLSAKQIFTGSLYCVTTFKYRKFFALEGYVTSFRRKHYFSECRKKSQGNLFVLRPKKLPVSENFIDRKREKGGIIKIFRRIFLSHLAEKFRRGTLQCFRKFRVSKRFIPMKWILPLSIKILL